MKSIRKILCLAVCALIAAAMLCLPVSAEKITKEGPTVKLPTLTAVPLDTVVVAVDMTDCPGVMAMTFTVSYDPDVLEYVDYEKGLCSDYTVVDHPDKGYVSFVNCENFNIKFDGTLLFFTFTVKEKAAPGFYEMKIRNIRPEKNGDSMTGCFADWNSNKFNPTVINGGITIGKTCGNVGHAFSEWQTTVKPLCKVDGIKIRSCSRCGHTETASIPMLGEHDYENFWTIDQEAVADVSGTMSRHCKNCSAVTDKKSFTIKDSEENKFENKFQENIKEEQWDRLELPKEPAFESTPSKPAESNSQSASSDTSSEEPEEDIPNAEDIVSNAKEEQNGIGVKIYRYLFGDGDEKGVLGKIGDALPKWLKTVSPIILIILVIVVIAIVVIR